MHTAEHLLNGEMARRYGCGRAFSAHIERKKSKLDYHLPSALSDDELRSLEDYVNAVVQEDVAVTEEYISRQEAMKRFDMSRLPEDASAMVRVVHVGDYDQCLCAGAHVGHTGEIGTLRITSSRYADGVQRLVFKLFSLIVFTVMAACNANAAAPEVEVVAPKDFLAKLEADSSAYLLDARRPEEFVKGHLRGARLNNWLQEDAFKQSAGQLDKSRTIYIYCRSGRRSGEAARYLAAEGYRVVDMDGGILGWTELWLPTVEGTATELIEAQGIGHDTFITPAGRTVRLHFIKHASLILEIGGRLVYIDPTGMFGHNFASLPEADAVMVTHEHYDHYDPAAIEQLSTADTRFVASRRVIELAGRGEAMAPGDTIDLYGIKVTATPAYNTSAGHEQFHPRDRQDVGFLFDIDGLRVYVAGDTEDIPEMADLGDIDIAFVPINQPFTMTPQQAIHAIDMIRPAIVYPYHYGDTDLTPIVEACASDPTVDVRLRPLQ